MTTSALPSPAPPGARPGRLGLAVLLSGGFITIFDLFVVNIAIPSMQRTLDASFAQINFIIVAYELAYGVLLIAGSRLGDRLGRRRLFVLGMLGFALTSALCGLAPDANALICARALGGGHAVPAGVRADPRQLRRPRAPPRVRPAGHDAGAGGHRRPGAGRLDRACRPVRPVLARDLPGQCAAGPGRLEAGAPSAGVARAFGLVDGLARCRAGRAGPGPADAGADRGPGAALACLDAGQRHAGRGRAGIVRARAARIGAAARRWWT